MNLLSIILQVTGDLISTAEAEEIKLSLWQLAKEGGWIMLLNSSYIYLHRKIPHYQQGI